MIASLILVAMYKLPTTWVCDGFDVQHTVWVVCMTVCLVARVFGCRQSQQPVAWLCGWWILKHCSQCWDFGGVTVLQGYVHCFRLSLLSRNRWVAFIGSWRTWIYWISEVTCIFHCIFPLPLPAQNRKSVLCFLVGPSGVCNFFFGGGHFQSLKGFYHKLNISVSQLITFNFLAYFWSGVADLFAAWCQIYVKSWRTVVPTIFVAGVSYGDRNEIFQHCKFVSSLALLCCFQRNTNCTQV